MRQKAREKGRIEVRFEVFVLFPSYLSLESGEAPDPEDLTRPRPRDGGLVVEVMVHAAVTVVDKRGKGGHRGRRRLFADAERVGKGGKTCNLRRYSGPSSGGKKNPTEMFGLKFMGQMQI